VYNVEYLHDFPSHIHAWAQADRYALALGFVENGLNLFKPQTFLYNHQFPDWWTNPGEHNITAVDFPIHDYSAALLMKVTGSTSPFVFRVYVLLYSVLGLFFLFQLARSVTRSFAASLFVVVFAATSPVFVYYQGSFLPTIPSLANAMIGVFCYYHYLKNHRHRHFWWSVVFLTLAAMARTTFAIPLIALFGVELLRVFRKETPWTPKILPVILSLMAIGAYLLYNGYLRNTYGSQFLSAFMPSGSFSEAIETIEFTFTQWGWEYFSWWHCVVFMLVTFFAFLSGWRKRKHLPETIGFFSLFIAVYLFGCLCFALLMMMQFPAHDYYFLDTFYLPIVLILSHVVATLNRNADFRNNRFTVWSLSLLATVLLLLVPIDSQQSRRETGPWDKSMATHRNFEGAASFLDSLGIPGSAKILVVDAVAPNLPFLHMERKGFAVMMPTEANIQSALHWNYDYVVVQNEFFLPVVYKNYPHFIDRVTFVGSNKKITVGRKGHAGRQSLTDFLGLKPERKIGGYQLSFESWPDSSWKNVIISPTHAFMGSQSGVVNSETEYGLTLTLPYTSGSNLTPATLFFSGYFLTESDAEVEVVVSISSGAQNLFYQAQSLRDWMPDHGDWTPIPLLFGLPAVQCEQCELAVYLWNKGGAELYFDEIDIVLYR
ncbi:MAG: hypothetical protein EA392_00200, partial [Cryomorphaceae bacterium]